MARKSKPVGVPAIPAAPPPTPRSILMNEEITANLEAAVHSLEQRALDQAVVLAQQAARRRGPLVKHFMELGRRFGKALDMPQKPALRIVEGGAQ